MATKLTNDIVDARLLSTSRTITRVGEYINAATKMEWECKTCNHHWHATANSVLNLKSDCPKCYGNTKYTNADIDSMIGAGIHRVGDYINFDTPIRWSCYTCGHTWTASPNGVITKHSGCPKCAAASAGINKSDRERQRVDEMLKQRNISTRQPYRRVVDRYDFVCNVCNHQWNTAMNNLLNSDTGCPSCVGLTKLSNAEVDTRLQNDNRPITRIGEYINATTKIQWKCHKCDGVWEATPDSVLNAKSGCSTCGTLGVASRQYFKRNPHKKNIPGYIYLIEGEYQGVKFLKVGITEHGVEQRFKGDKKKYSIRMIHAKQMSFYDAYLTEQLLLQRHIKSLVIPDERFGGKTECLKYDEEIKKDILSTLMS